MVVIFRPRATTASARPTWRYSSSVRACTASARDVVPGSAVLSTIRTRMPSRVSHSANTKPVGPAPTMRTSVFSVNEGCIWFDRTATSYRDHHKDADHEGHETSARRRARCMISHSRTCVHKNLARILTEADKIVVSRIIQPSDLAWENSRFLNDELLAGVASLKRTKWRRHRHLRKRPGCSTVSPERTDERVHSLLGQPLMRQS